MSADARIMATLPLHPKTRKLIKRHGQAAAWNLVCLFLFACENKSKGILDGMTAEDIELGCDWQGEDGEFVNALVEVGFLDQGDDGYEIHDWAVHNPWASGSEMRSQRASWNALCKHYGRDGAAERMPEYAKSIGNYCKQDATGMPVAENSTAPSPSPSLKDQELLSSANSDDSCPHQKIIALYHEVLPAHPHVREWTPARQTLLRNRWKEKPERQSLDWWRGYFEYVSKCDFICGKMDSRNGRLPFQADLEWLVRPGNLVKVIEGKYQNPRGGV